MLTALEALTLGNSEPPLRPLVPEWDDEIIDQGCYVAFLEALALRLIERGMVVEVLA